MEMGRFDGYLICTDFDGTLAVNATVSEGNRRAIEYFMSEGGAFTVCTGRTPEFILEKLPFTPNVPLITVNGSLVYDIPTGKRLKSWSVGRDIWEQAEWAVSRYGDGVEKSYFVIASSGETLWIENKDILASVEMRGDEQVLKAVLRVRDGESDRIFSELTEAAGKRLNVSRSWRGGIELQAPDSSKGVAVGYLRELLGERAQTVVCAGDYENDISLLRAADISYAVGDAVEALRREAMRVTVPCADDAVAQIICDLERETRV